MIADTNSQYFSLDEICSLTDLSSQTLVEIVDQGIVDPVGESPASWVFTTQMVTVTKRAIRLHRDLDIDWSGIALAISLLEELEQLRLENRELNRRLKRFMVG